MPLQSYGKLCTQFYDITKPEPPPVEFQFYRALCEAAGGPVLEAMCGSGRFLVPLLQLGIDIEGMDASADMLQACRETARRRGLKPVLHEQMLQDMALPRRYKLIIIPADSFVLVTDIGEARASLRKLYEHLLPGGRLALAIMTPTAAGRLPGQWTGRWVKREDGATIVLSVLSSYDKAKKVESQVHKYELFISGKLADTEMEHFAMRYYGRDEFSGLLVEAGFRDVSATVPYTGAPAADTDWEIMYEGKR